MGGEDSDALRGAPVVPGQEPDILAGGKVEPAGDAGAQLRVEVQEQNRRDQARRGPERDFQQGERKGEIGEEEREEPTRAAALQMPAAAVTSTSLVTRATCSTPACRQVSMSWTTYP